MTETKDRATPLTGRVLVQDPGYRMDEVTKLLAPLGLAAERVEGELASDDAVVLLSSDDYPLGVAELERLPSLRVAISGSVGFDHIALRAAAERGIWVGNTPAFCTTEVADSTIALILALLRGTVFLDRHVRAGGWDRTVTGPLRRLSSTKLGVVGLGRIGRAVADRARWLGLQVWATDASPAALARLADGIRPAEFDELLGACDVVSLHVPLDRTAAPLIGKCELDLMPAGAMLVNTSRGGLVDLEALTAALGSGRLRGAALDVLPSEPPAADDPVRRLDNLILTPHAAWYSPDAEDEAFRQPIEAVAALATGHEPDGILVRGTSIAPALPERR